MPVDLSNKIILKIRLGSDVRKIPVHNEDMSFDDLVLMMLRVFADQIDTNDDIVVKYADEDGDLITIRDNNDLNFAIQSSRILKLTLFVNGYPRELDDIEANAIRKELVEIRNKTNRIIDQLDNRPSHRQDSKGKSAAQGPTKADRTHKTSELVNGTESHHESRPALASPAPIPPAAGMFKESREFDPLSQRGVDESLRTVEEPQEKSRSETPASNLSLNDSYRKGAEEAQQAEYQQQQQLHYYQQQQHQQMKQEVEPPPPTIQPSVQEVVLPPQPSVLSAASYFGAPTSQPQQPLFGQHPPPPSTHHQQQQPGQQPPSPYGMSGQHEYGQQAAPAPPTMPQQPPTHYGMQSAQQNVPPPPTSQQQQHPMMPPQSQQHQQMYSQPQQQHQQQQPSAGYPPTSMSLQSGYPPNFPPSMGAPQPPGVSAAGPPPMGPPPMGAAMPGGGNPFSRAVGAGGYGRPMFQPPQQQQHY